MNCLTCRLGIRIRTAGTPVKTVQTEVAGPLEEVDQKETEIDGDQEQEEMEKGETGMLQTETKVAGVQEEMEKAETDLRQGGMATKIGGVL